MGNKEQEQKLSKGVEIRAEIDRDTVKALLLINGGGAVALLTLLPKLIEEKFQELAAAVMVGVLILMIGLLCAVIHNRLRRKCSLHYEQHKMRPPKGKIFGFRLPEPTICFISTMFMWASAVAFFSAGAFVAVYGILWLGWPSIDMLFNTS